MQHCSAVNSKQTVFAKCSADGRVKRLLKDITLFLIYFQSLSVEENVFWTDTQSLEHISGFAAWCRHTAASQERVAVVMQI